MATFYTAKEKALAHVRSVCPELVEESYEYGMKDQGEKPVITLHDPHLEHWLRGLEKAGKLYQLCNCGVMYWNTKGEKTIFHFDLVTGQPESEADYKAYCEIAGV